MTEQNLKNVVLDTSALINNRDFILNNKDKYNYIVGTTQCSELDNQKESSDSRRQYIGRQGLTTLSLLDKDTDANIQYIVNDIVEGLPDSFSKSDNDNKILTSALLHKASIMTADRGMLAKARSLQIEVVDSEDFTQEANYKGFRVFELDCTEDSVCELLNELAEDSTKNIFNLLPNEFAILKDTARPIFDEDGISTECEIQAIMQWDGHNMIPLKYKNINNTFVGKVQPRNLEQKMLLSLLQNKNVGIVLASGTYGSGKDFLMMSQAMDMLQKNEIERIVWFRNPVEVKGISPVGFLKGSWQEKMAPYSAILDDVLGESFGTEMFVANGKLEIGHLGAIRGRTFKNSLVILTEMQNCSVEVIQLIISRLGEGSRFFCNGDYHQIDAVSHKYSTINKVIEVLGSEKEFGTVQLDKVERSKLADLARKFD